MNLLQINIIIFIYYYNDYINILQLVNMYVYNMIRVCIYFLYVIIHIDFVYFIILYIFTLFKIVFKVIDSNKGGKYLTIENFTYRKYVK
jgi:hypothetical protein